MFHLPLFLASLLTLVAHAESTKDLSRRLAKKFGPINVVENCQDRPENAPLNPDKDSTSLAPPGARAIAEVVFHGRKMTDPASNYGIKAFARDAVLSDGATFNAAAGFYERLRDHDKKAPSNDGGIGTRIHGGADLMDMALKASHGSHYLALKSMIIFGHDNMMNQLGNGDTPEPCRTAILDHYLAPRKTSELYLNGAIKGLEYSPQQIAQGEKIALACADPSMTVAERTLCNDNLSSYQADYYHVITAAFLGCRKNVFENRESTSEWTSRKTEESYLVLAKKYKLKAFREQLKLRRGDISGGLHSLVEAGLERIEDNGAPVLLPKSKYPKVSERDYKIAATVLARMEFEVAFRMSQHKMGFEYGKKFCKDEKTTDSYCPVE